MLLKLVIFVALLESAVLAAPSDEYDNYGGGIGALEGEEAAANDTSTPSANATEATTTAATTTLKTTTAKPTTTKKPAPTKKPKPLECSKEKFQTLDNCCKVSIGNIFSAAATQNCTKDKKLISWLNDYNFNLLQNPKNNNSVNFTDPATNKTICSVAPIAVCVYNASKLLGENNTLNSAAIAELFKLVPAELKNLSSSVTTITVEAILKLIPGGVASYTCPTKKKGVTTSVNLIPLFHAQLMQAKALAACPEVANPLPKKENCVDTKDSFSKCQAALSTDFKTNPGVNFQN